MSWAPQQIETFYRIYRKALSCLQAPAFSFDLADEPLVLCQP